MTTLKDAATYLAEEASYTGLSSTRTMARLVEAAQRVREAASGCHIFRVGSCRTCQALDAIDAIEEEK